MYPSVCVCVCMCVLEGVRHVQKIPTQSSIPRGDLDPQRNQARMMATTNRFFFSKVRRLKPPLLMFHKGFPLNIILFALPHPVPL